MKTEKLKTPINFLILLLWAFISGYICIAGLAMVNAIEKVKVIEKKADKEIVWKISMNGFDPEQIIKEIKESEQNELLTVDDIESIRNLKHVYWYYSFPGYSYVRFLTIMPYIVLLFLVTGAAGLLGSVARIIIDHVTNIIEIKDSKIIAFPIFGFIMGELIYGISYLVPSLFVRGDTNPNGIAIILLCFFSGVFTDTFYKWIIVNIEKLFKSKES